ncbi:MAG TPA: hypothetical protein VLW65_22005 [Bryobacteraceae bacterium]|nr:hypothetical protein [Bryobacteraceae bacterium]
MTVSSLRVLLIVALAFAPLSCKRAKTVHVEQTEEEGPRLASVVHVSDPKVEPQLISGFYAIEGNAWRWTAKQFSVVLRVPTGAAQRGATLDLALTVPQVTIDKLKTISLSASADGHPLPPETYTQTGQFDYKRDLAPGTLANSSVRLEFQLDKAMAPGNGDLRELGVIVRSIGLDAK